ncbi:hypothetical protein N7450_001984 [Penicillium hetheringtonii]|uniref:Uncharacterized protein n=1 Tax=Penicillium hetheringtonii TaxID=911720 RepID=A0AAD6H0V2_9EURO|nr:hypothetical protein N7450_001984 [Penicillium hetheringtonii]
MRKRHQKVEGGSEWTFEERDCSLNATHMLLARVMVAKVEDGNRLAQILRTIPIRLKADNIALGTNVIDWQIVRNEAMSYCQKKKDQHRFDGQGNFDTSKASTYNLLERKETIK